MTSVLVNEGTGVLGREVMSRRHVLITLAGFFLAIVFYQQVIRQLVAGLPGVPGGAGRIRKEQIDEK